MLEVTRRIQFCAGHRLMGHEGGCRHVHGHNYVAHITAQPLLEGSAVSTDPGSYLDTVGRVVDFSVLKERVGGWIDSFWDHQFIANRKDAALISMLDALHTPVYHFPGNPTAENMAAFLLNVVCPEVLHGYGVRVVRVVLEETENCSATAVLSSP